MSSPAQLFSLVKADEILKSPTNKSTAKNHWSFSRTSRFKTPKQDCDQFYHIPGIKQNKNRKTTFGYGLKTNLDYGKNPQQNSPSPNAYKLKSFVEINIDHQKGFTPLVSRNSIQPMSYIQLQPCKVPPPGRYDKFRYNQSPKWSMKARSSVQLNINPDSKQVPAPTCYQFTDKINASGNYKLSNHRNSKSKVFNPPHSKRFHQSSTLLNDVVIDNPGPGTYKPINDLSDQGVYVMSKNVSTGKRKFLLGNRNSFTELSARKSSTPGPGTYRTPSQFGQYDEIHPTKKISKNCQLPTTSKTNSSRRGTPVIL